MTTIKLFQGLFFIDFFQIYGSYTYGFSVLRNLRPNFQNSTEWLFQEINKQLCMPKAKVVYKALYTNLNRFVEAYIFYFYDS